MRIASRPLFNHRENRLITVNPERKAFTEDPAGDGNPGALLRADVMFSEQARNIRLRAERKCGQMLTEREMHGGDQVRLRPT
jgi:hypothetical protein